MLKSRSWFDWWHWCNANFSKNVPIFVVLYKVLQES